MKKFEPDLISSSYVIMTRYREVLFILVSTTLCSALQRQSLNGQWSVEGGPSGTVIHNATVPGGIFSDLMNHGDIEDIFFGNGDTDYRWVGESDWTYKKSFTVDKEFLQHRIIYIVFEGVDTFSAISINGNEVGTIENMFVRYAFNIKKYLKVGSNDISVKFTSSVTKAMMLGQDTSNPYKIPPNCPPREFNGICYANRIRKMQAAFSWDWGPAFASSGIWKDVYLQGFNTTVIDYVVATTQRNPTTGGWTLTVVTYLNSGGESSILGTVTAKIRTKDFVHTTSTSTKLNESITFSIDISDTEINAWWPNGYGTQDLYNLTVEFVGDTSPEKDEKTVRIGFRTIELVQDELERGLTFYFKVNGQPIFAKGANEIPINILPEKGQDRATVQYLLKSVKDVNMNMIRVWGGGVYESDYFYDLADEYGILIWQDFMFACALYPATDPFLKNVRAEVRHQVKRLGSHPSMAIWSGNNENEGALAQNWWGTMSNSDRYGTDYIELYVFVIQQEVLHILPNANYVTSSPTNGLDSDRQNHLAKNPADPLYGDVHVYDYRKDSWSVSTFPIPRFSSEYGYQSMPSIEAWMTATDNEADISPNSTFLLKRQHHLGGNSQNINLIGLQLQLPNTTNKNYVKAFVYYSQILQAQSIKTQTEHYRSFKGRVDENSRGYTMGALYWQLNDVWVAPTWSGIDFTGRWKMLHYQARDFFNTTIVTARLTTDELEIYAIHDGLEIPPVLVKSVIRVYSWNSLEPLISIEFPVALDPLKAVLVTSVNAPTVLTTAGCGSTYAEAKSNCFFYILLTDENNENLVPANYFFPEKLKNSLLPNANVQVKSVNGTSDDREFDIVVITDSIALFVWLDSHDIKGIFSENGFLQVEPSKTVHFTSEVPILEEELRVVLTVTHVRDPVYL